MELCPHLLAELEELPNRQRRAKVMTFVAQRELKVEQAASILSLSVRQIQRLKKRMTTGGVCWDEHGNRNRAPVNAMDPGQKALIIRLARTCYAGLNDTRIHSELQETHGITASRQTVRRILRSAGIAPVLVKSKSAGTPERESVEPPRQRESANQQNVGASGIDLAIDKLSGSGLTIEVHQTSGVLVGGGRLVSEDDVC